MSFNNLIIPKGPTKKTWFRWLLLRLISLLILFIVLALGAGFIIKDKFIYYPYKKIEDTPSRYQTPFDEVSLLTTDGTKIKGWFVPSPDETNKITAIIFQGNSGNRSLMIDRLLACRMLGINGFIVDYPGFGDSEGSPSERENYQAAEAAWQWVAQNKSKPEDIVIYGYSLGGGVASWLAEKHNPKALILDSTFSRLKDVPTSNWPIFKPYFDIVMFDDYNTAERLKNIKCPVLFLHNADDKMIPVEFSQRMYDSYQGGPKEIVIGSGGHFDFILNFIHDTNHFHTKIAEIMGLKKKEPPQNTNKDT